MFPPLLAIFTLLHCNQSDLDLFSAIISKGGYLRESIQKYSECLVHTCHLLDIAVKWTFHTAQRKRNFCFLIFKKKSMFEQDNCCEVGKAFISFPDISLWDVKRVIWLSDTKLKIQAHKSFFFFTREDFFMEYKLILYIHLWHLGTLRVNKIKRLS